MRKFKLIALIAVLVLVSVTFVSAKTFITGYDVNNDYAPVQVEKGVYTPGISLYPAQIGISTKSNLVTAGNLTVGGETQAKRVIQGGTVASASSSLTVAMSLTAAQVCNNSVVTVNTAATAGTVAAASLDITLPATSTLFADCLDNSGDSVSFLFVNASPTAASTTQMIAGTGCDDYTVPSAGDDAIPGLGIAKITLTRATDVFGVNHTVDCMMTIEEFND